MSRSFPVSFLLIFTSYDLFSTIIRSTALRLLRPSPPAASSAVFVFVPVRHRSCLPIPGYCQTTRQPIAWHRHPHALPPLVINASQGQYEGRCLLCSEAHTFSFRSFQQHLRTRFPSRLSLSGGSLLLFRTRLITCTVAIFPLVLFPSRLSSPFWHRFLFRATTTTTTTNHHPRHTSM